MKYLMLIPLFMLGCYTPDALQCPEVEEPLGRIYGTARRETPYYTSNKMTIVTIAVQTKENSLEYSSQTLEIIIGGWPIIRVGELVGLKRTRECAYELCISGRCRPVLE